MGLRSFRDESGAEWRAWDVMPKLVERRVGARRQVGGITSAAEARGADRRLGIDRRMVATQRAFLNDGMSSGWLAFESAREKRRLTPIPGDWLHCPTARLAEYCRQAAVVRDSRGDARLGRAFPGEHPPQGGAHTG